MFRLFLPFAAKRCRCAMEQLPLVWIRPQVVREFTRHLEEVRHCGPATINQRLTALRAWACFVEPTVRNIWNGAARCKPFISGTRAFPL